MKKAVVLAYFGTADKNEVINAVYKMEESLKEKFSGKIVSAFMLERLSILLEKREGIKINTLDKTLELLKYEDYDEVLVQAIYLIDGEEFFRIEEAVSRYKGDFKSISIGSPLIYGDKKTMEVCAKKLAGAIVKSIDKSKNILFIGHGSKTYKDEAYKMLYKEIIDLSGRDNIYMGTLAGEQNIESVIASLKNKNIDNVSIEVLFMMIGRHVRNDIISGEDSWVNKFKNSGINSSVNILGLLQREEVKNIFEEKILTNKMFN